MRMRFFGLLFFVAAVVAATSARGKGIVWTSNDYFIHYSLYYSGKSPLPHLRDNKQKALFAHLTDPRNISEILLSGQSSQIKLQELRKVLAMLGSYRASYYYAVVMGEPLEQELTEIQIFTLEVASSVAKTMRDRGEIYDTHSALTTMIEGAMRSVAESDRYLPVQRAEIAEAVARHYPAIAQVLTDGDRSRLREFSASLAPPAEMARLKVAIAAMRLAISSSR